LTKEFTIAGHDFLAENRPNSTQPYFFKVGPTLTKKLFALFVIASFWVHLLDKVDRRVWAVSKERHCFGASLAAGEPVDSHIR